MIRIGISGGTFDPIHNAHLIIAEEIREMFGLDKVIFVPSGRPPHKQGAGRASAEDRYRMVELAVAGNPRFEPCRIEIGREGYSYTVDTVSELKGFYGEDARFFFITGADVVPELESWKDYRRVFTLCEFIVAMRPGYDRERFDSEIKRLKDVYGAEIHIAETSLIDISSTALRERLEQGKTIKYLVPEKVEEYISQKGLYTTIENEKDKTLKVKFK